MSSLPTRLPRRAVRPTVAIAVAIALLAIAGFVTGPSPVHAGDDKPSWPSVSAQKVLTVDDYGRWSRVSDVSLSPDGRWMSHAVVPNEGDRTLHLQQIDGETRHQIPVGSSPSFSADSRFVKYTVSPGKKEAEKLTRAKKPVVRKLVLRNLESGTLLEFDNVATSSFSEDGLFLAIRKNRADRTAKHRGADLLLHDLTTGVTRNIGNVETHAFDKSSTFLAYTVDAADDHGNGVYLVQLGTDRTHALDVARLDYSRLTWSEEGGSLAFLRGSKPDKKEHRANDLVVLRDVGTRRESRHVLAADDDSVTDGMVVSDLGRISFSEDERRIFFGLKAQADAATKGKGADVDVWHWDDDRVQSVQARRSSFEKRATVSAAFDLATGAAVQLGNDDRESVQIVGKGRWGIARDTTKYRKEVTWGGARADYYRIHLGSGEATPIATALGRPMGSSPDGRWFLFLQNGKVYSHDLDRGHHYCLSDAAGVSFVNELDDHPYEKPSFGVAGFTSDGLFVLLNHRYDLWRVALDGSGADNFTGGAGERDSIRFRYSKTDPEADTIDTAAPIVLSAYGEWTKKSGYFARTPTAAEPTPLLYVDKQVGRPVRARHADAVAISMQSFENAPDYWITNAGFEAPRQVTDSNPQQSEYGWGRRVLVDYENGRGARMQATLTLPAGYEEGKRYPVLVYFYEKMSQRHHSYSFPRYDDRPHMSTYASDGYVVLMPDVVYEPGRPGDSALDCVTSAVKKAIELGYADPERIALQGHSWGGYQSSFILTQTDLFCAIVTGAPVTNLVSFYNELYKSSGSVQQGIVERGQVRMGTTPWDDMALYHSQSPVHNVRDITTPFMILHGTDDGAVDWHQGLELYNAARRNGKEVILLSYPGEGHHLGKRENQIDFQVRMKQFFDHYCKGTPAPAWMTDGVPYLERETATPR